MGGMPGGGGRGCPWPLSEPGVRCGFRRVGKFVTVRMPVKDRFDATLSATVPVAYIVKKSAMPDSALQRLRLHGVVVEEARLTRDVAAAEAFVVDSIVRRAQPFQGHSETRVEGRWQQGAPSLAGADVYVVRTTQPLGVLAVELLDPRSDDGLVTWNFFDAALGAGAIGKQFPVIRTKQAINFPTRIIQ